MLSILLITLHRRHTRKARLSNRRPNFICRFFSARFGTGGNSSLSGDQEEKSGLIDDDEDDQDQEDDAGDAVELEISQLRNAAGVVGDIVAAEEGRFVPSSSSFAVTSSSSSSSPSTSSQPQLVAPQLQEQQQHFVRMDSLPGYRGMCMGMGMTGIDRDIDETELPAYEDNDGSEEGSMVQDGFRGGSTFTPSGSENGSLHEVLGAPKN